MRLAAEFVTDSLVAVVDRLALHDHAHTSAVGSIIHPAVLILCIFSYLSAVNVNFAGFPGPAHNTLPQHSFAHLREKRHYFYFHKNSSVIKFRGDFLPLAEM